MTIPKISRVLLIRVHVVFLLAPTIGLPFPVVQAGFRWLLVILTLASVFLWLRVLRWRPSDYGHCDPDRPDVWQLRRGAGNQAAAVDPGGKRAAGGLRRGAGGGIFLARRFLAGAGDDQASTGVAGCGLAGAVGGQRLAPASEFFWSFGLTTAIFLAASEYILPGWIGQFREAVAAYRQYTGGAGSLLDVLATPVLGKVLAAAAVIAVAVTGWRVRRASHDSAAFSTMLALVLAVTLVIVPTFAPYNQVLLLPAVFLIAASWKELWGRNRLTRVACGVAVLVVFWPWLASCGLMLASLFLPAGSVQTSLGCASLYEPGHSSGGLGIAGGVRRRSTEDLAPKQARHPCEKLLRS